MDVRYATYTPNNIKVLCQKSKHNITLNKEQIISYFTELHKKNSTFIQNYINSINTNNAIDAYVDIESYYDKLTKEGIIPSNLLSKYNDGTYKRNKEADLIVLDYLKQSNQSNFKILLNDELFYDYLVFSLQEYTILYYQGYIAETNNMLFNLAAYMDILDRQKIEETLNVWYDSLPEDIEQRNALLFFCTLA